jgi:hypothetical protein
MSSTKAIGTDYSVQGNNLRHSEMDASDQIRNDAVL